MNSRSVESSQSVGTLGMRLLIVSLTMLFGASLAAYLLVRHQHQPWPPAGFPALPRSLWLSTLIILLVSVTIQGALGAARRGETALLKRDLTLSLLLALGFLAAQWYAWIQVYQQIDAIGAGMAQYAKLFYFLTGLHAAHVLGGLGPLAVVTGRAYAGRYGPACHAGVRYSAMYWHFLDAAWCVVFIAVYLV